MSSCKSVIAGVPCAHCPFRKNVPVYLRRERRQEIADSMMGGQDFPCHATVDYSEEDDNGQTAPDTSGSQICAGGAKAMMLSGGTTQNMRIADRLGLVDLDRAAETGAAVWSLDEWIRLAEGATGDAPSWEIPEYVETCNTVNSGCLAPAGFMGAGGGVVAGTVAADAECSECGEGVCSNCIRNGLCGNCSGWDDEDEDDQEGVEYSDQEWAALQRSGARQ